MIQVRITFSNDEKDQFYDFFSKKFIIKRITRHKTDTENEAAGNVCFQEIQHKTN